ncbi:helix-turn-helix domain-containing protein [Pseudoxanthomonas winnipegensis]|uniref:XRE family transcriptional regulator n=1 Tax=Pseudoxanthomonas winnipegensis TaxID=2480810 RepID=A0A4V6ML12_9GAMM|nr:helix-turn-helix transcriptional regulator [Pseudoxanthomonas winnipegensis]TAA44926.1 XRE family transcriptional regulator [Pseudoxanthomonas winnipegensis]
MPQAAEALFEFNVCERIRLARRERGCSQAELAASVGVDRTTVIRWEQSTHSVPATESLRRLSDALQVSVEWLLYGDSREHDEHVSVEKSASRKAIEVQLVNLSKHVPISYLINIVALLESAKLFLDA